MLAGGGKEGKTCTGRYTCAWPVEPFTVICGLSRSTIVFVARVVVVVTSAGFSIPTRAFLFHSIHENHRYRRRLKYCMVTLAERRLPLFNARDYIACWHLRTYQYYLDSTGIEHIISLLPVKLISKLLLCSHRKNCARREGWAFMLTQEGGDLL